MPFFSKGLTGQAAVGPMPRPSPVTSGYGVFPTSTFGAGQGPGPSTGQLADQPFNNQFNFQIPQPSGGSSDMGSATPSSGNGGVSQYVPVIIVGVIIAGLGWFLFERKKR